MFSYDDDGTVTFSLRDRLSLALLFLQVQFYLLVVLSRSFFIRRARLVSIRCFVYSHKQDFDSIGRTTALHMRRSKNTILVYLQLFSVTRFLSSNTVFFTFTVVTRF